MKRKSVFALTIVLAVAVAALLLPALGGPVQAQAPCKAFRAIWHATLPAPEPFLSTDTWGGSVYASLAGEFFLGGMAGNDGTQSGQGAISIFRGGLYKVCFGASVAGWGGASDCPHSFTYEVPHAVVIWPGADRLGSYMGTANIVHGTGRFASASGHLAVPVPFTLWTPDEGVTWRGRGSGEITGSICGVK
jgi:hypothetical protein